MPSHSALGAQGFVLACAGASWPPPGSRGQWFLRAHVLRLRHHLTRASGSHTTIFRVQPSFAEPAAAPGYMSPRSERRATARRRELECGVSPRATSLAPVLCRTAPGRGVRRLRAGPPRRPRWLWSQSEVSRWAHPTPKPRVGALGQCDMAGLPLSHQPRLLEKILLWEWH